MKKNFWAIVCMALAFLVVIAVTMCRAEEINMGNALKKIPALKQGVAYSLLDNDFSYLSTIELANWKGLTLEAGYSSNDKAVAVLSYELLKLKNYISLPILDLIEFNAGVYGGYGRIALGAGNAKDNNEWDMGFSVTLISVKF